MKAVDGIVLAAGPSRRFRAAPTDGSSEHGRPIKQLLRFEGESLVRRACRTAIQSRLARVVVVVGCQAEAVRKEIDDLPVAIVENPRFEDGQSTSVRAALGRLGDEAEAAVFIPCDQPFLGSETLDRLVTAWEATGKDIVVPTSEGRRRAPVLLARSLFGELARITGDAGGRQLFAGHAESIAEVEIEDPRALRDVDTLEDYRELVQE